MGKYEHTALLKEDPSQNDALIRKFMDFLEMYSVDTSLNSRIFTSFAEVLYNALNHSRTGFYPKAQSLHQQGFIVTVKSWKTATDFNFSVSNYSDKMRSDELVRRLSLLNEKGDMHLGPASYIYNGDPKEHNGRGHGLRDIFRESDEAFVYVEKHDNLCKNTLTARFKIG